MQKSYAGVDYFVVANNPPSTRFATDYGALRTAPVAPAWEDQAWMQCAAPAAAPADPPTDNPTTSTAAAGTSTAVAGTSTADGHAGHSSSTGSGSGDNAAAQAASLSLIMVAALCALGTILQL